VYAVRVNPRVFSSGAGRQNCAGDDVEEVVGAEGERGLVADPGECGAQGVQDTAIAAGAEDRVTATVAEVTGHQPRTFRAFCAERLGGAR